MSRSVGDVITRIAYFAGYGNFRLIFKIVAAEDPYRVERLQGQILVLASQSIAQIECEDRGRVVRRLQPDYFGVLLIGLRKQIVVRMNYIGQLHTVEIDSFFRIRKNR